MKYELTDETWKFYGTRMYRIRALRSISRHKVKAGDKGGFVSKFANLSQDGDCWVGEDAYAIGNASVRDNAYVGGASQLMGSPTVGGNSHVMGGSKIYGNTVIKDNVYIEMDGGHSHTRSGDKWKNTYGLISDNTEILGNARIMGTPRIGEKAIIFGTPMISGKADIWGEAQISGGIIRGNCLIRGKARLWENPLIEGNAKLGGTVEISGTVYVGGNSIFERDEVFLDSESFGG